MIDAAFYWTGLIVWVCGTALGLCALVVFTLGRVWSTVRATYSMAYIREATSHYQKIKPYKRNGAIE